MDLTETLLEAPEEFPFPFEPYSIQKDLMHHLYTAIEKKKLGIFESPTGTGKSMSLICASLQWLLDAEKRKKQDLNNNIKKLEEKLKKTALSDNWLDEHAEQAKLKHKKDEYISYHNKILNKETKIKEIIESAKQLKEDVTVKKKKFMAKETEVSKNKENKPLEKEAEPFDEDEILLEDVLVEEKPEKEQSSDSEPETEKGEEYNSVKIYLCSRTHSQLAQLVGEIQKSPFKNFNIRVVSLASRQNYCINESVLKLKHLSLINERCQDLHQKKKGKTTKNSEKGEKLKKQKISSGCPFYQQANIDILKAKALTEVQDVEEMVGLGKAINGCPYYASRASIEDAQVVIVPYNTILHKSTRLACGINLEDSVVIIDEAHNLLDTISNIYSCTVTGHQLACSHSQLVQYKEKYHSRFSPFNLLYLNQLIFIVNKLLIKIGGKSNTHPNTANSKPSSSTLETLVEFIFSCEIDTINLFKVLDFVLKSKIVHKLKGYVEKYKPAVVIHKKKEEKGVSAFLKNLSSKKDDTGKNSQDNEKDLILETEDLLTGNPLLSVVAFIEALMNHCVDGRVVTNVGTTIGNSSIKFLLLNPAAHFSDIVKQARSVILAGGTMQPISEFTDQLFYLAGGQRDRIYTFSCGHVIPPSNILPIIVSAGPSGKVFDFSFQHRADAALLDELGRLLVNITNIIPAGIVCFFPSYDYEQTVFQHFQKKKIIEKLEKKKKVLREPKKSNQVDQILKLYSKNVEERGAVLFSVVGGKLSEGLNFSDDLGRCVVVVGLPYPNLTSPELKEKMNYLNTTINPGAGRIYYENLCMKAVNQSIGRSVRHKDDYASVLLIDHRYSRNQCQEAVPEWIKKSLRIETKFGPVMESLAKFFAGKKKNKAN